jgi:hypothetical protein
MTYMPPCGATTSYSSGRSWGGFTTRLKKESHMIYAYVLIEAEPTRVQDLIKELPDMELDGSVIKQVHAVTGRYDLIAFVESPDMQSLGN